MSRRRVEKRCEFGEVLTTLLEKHNETTYSLAEKLGIQQAAVAQYTTCKRFPNVQILEKIARGLNLSTEEKRKLYTAYLKIAFSGEAVRMLKKVDKNITAENVSEKLKSIVDKLGKAYQISQRAKVNAEFVRKVMNLKFENMRVIEHKGSFASVIRTLNLSPSLEAQVLYLFLKSRKAEDIISTLTKGNL